MHRHLKDAVILSPSVICDCSFVISQGTLSYTVGTNNIQVSEAFRAEVGGRLIYGPSKFLCGNLNFPIHGIPADVETVFERQLDEN